MISPVSTAAATSTCVTTDRTDMIARMWTDRLAQSLGQPFVIDNRGGAGGILGNMVGDQAASLLTNETNRNGPA